MLHKTYLFDIPIYRLNEKLYYQQREEYINNSMFNGLDKKNFFARNPENNVWFTDYLENRYGGCWEFNEIIGYIRLYFWGDQIRGCFLFQNSRRIRRTRKKIIQYKSHNILTGYSINNLCSNKEIFNLISKDLENLKRNKFKNRFVDTTILDALGPHINWISLFEAHKTNSSRKK